MKKIFIGLLTFLLVFNCQAQQKEVFQFSFQGKKYNIKEFIEERGKIIEFDGREVVKVPFKVLIGLTLFFSGSLKITQFNQQVAESRLKQSYSPFDLNWKNSYTNQLRNNFSPFSVDNQSTVNGSGSSQIVTELNQRTLSGISYNLQFMDVASEQIVKNFDNDNNLGNTQTSNGHQIAASFSANIPIGQDFGEINASPIRRSGLTFASSKIQYLDRVYTEAGAIKDFFWDLVSIYSSIEEANRAIKISQKIVADNQVRVELGIIPKTLLLESIVNLKQTEDRKKQLYLRVQEIENFIKIALNLRDIPYGLYPVGPSSSLGAEFLSVEKYLEEIESTHPDFLNLKIESERVKIDQAEADNLDKPDLDLNLSYTLNGLGEDRSKASNLLTEQKIDDYQISFSWNYPIGKTERKERLVQSNLNRMRVLRQKSLLRDSYEIQLNTILDNLQFLRVQLKTLEDRIELLKEIYQYEQYKYELQTNTSLDVLEAQTDLLNAQVNKVNFESEYEKVFYRLLITRGEFFKFLEIDLENINLESFFEELLNP